MKALTVILLISIYSLLAVKLPQTKNYLLSIFMVGSLMAVPVLSVAYSCRKMLIRKFRQL